MYSDHDTVRASSGHNCSINAACDRCRHERTDARAESHDLPVDVDNHPGIGVELRDSCRQLATAFYSTPSPFTLVIDEGSGPGEGHDLDAIRRDASPTPGDGPLARGCLRARVIFTDAA